MNKVLITGATGFVGQVLTAQLLQRGYALSLAVRAGSRARLPGGEVSVIGITDIGPATDWSQALQGVEIVIHLAARVHVMRDAADDPLQQFRKVNTAATAHLARCAAASGVKRLVYVSSIKVNGEETAAGGRYSEQDLPAPQDPYGISKWEAEQALLLVAQQTGLEVVIVRPPLVYGPGVKGNFAQMLRVISCGVPLPLASVRNQRDLIYVGNLVDALIACAMHPAAAGQTYLLSDGECVSTPELLRRSARALAVPPRVWPFPPVLLRWSAKLLGKSAQADRLLGSLQVDSGKIRRELNWSPPYTLQQGLQATALWYRNRKTI